MKFLLVLYYLIGGQVHTSIVDYDLSAADCAYALEAHPDRLHLSCEADHSVG